MHFLWWCYCVVSYSIGKRAVVLIIHTYTYGQRSRYIMQLNLPEMLPQVQVILGKEDGARTQRVSCQLL